MKAFSLGVGVVLAVSGCSSNSGDAGDNTGTGGMGGQFPGGAAGFVNPNAGAAGIVNPGGGGYQPGAGGYQPGMGGYQPGMGGYTPGAGGVVNPGAGGFVNPGAGGANPGAGGVNPGAGGTDPSAGGAQPGAGGTGTVTLVSCDMRTETSANPITQGCSDVITPTGTPVKLGPYGAAMDSNVGKGFENPDPNDMATCPAFVQSFAENATLSQQLLDVGTQPCNATAPNTGSCLDFKLYSVYRPANWPAGPIPVITWGNGTCAQPEGYGTLLRYIASYGYLVVAANSREVGSGAPLTKALDFIQAANQDSSSPYFGHVDMTKVGVAGHSQGAGAAAIAVGDSRASNVILFNGLSGGGASKTFLTISGEYDIAATTAAAMSSTVNAAPKAAYLYYHHPTGTGQWRGHLVLMMTPERVVDAAKNWFELLFRNDPAAHDYYVGTNCGLCNHSADYDFGEHGL